MTVLFGVEVVLCLLALVITVNTLGNLGAFVKLGTLATVDDGAPFVSVLVPARNEERAISACLASLIRQDYPAYEILVLDDSSTDATAAIVRQYTGCADRVRLISGAALPADWLGKAFACYQLSMEARGDVLLFTDADTDHDPRVIRSVVGAIAAGADVVTAFPEQVVGTWAEALVVPFMLFTVWAFLPVGRVWSDPSPRVVAANGQLLAFTRRAYDCIGGHAAVRASALDDVNLARLAKRAGLRVRLADGVGMVRTRMYTSASDVWQGFSKNAFALVGRSIVGAVVFAGFPLLLYVVPIGLLAQAVASRGRIWYACLLPLLLIAMALLQTGCVAYRTRRPLWQMLVHPLSALAFVAILANAVYWDWRGYGVWKGRRFSTPGRRGRRE